jgi:hypothetical protein
MQFMRRNIFLVLVIAFGYIIYVSTADENPSVPEKSASPISKVFQFFKKTEPKSPSTIPVANDVSSGTANFKAGEVESFFANIPQLQDWIDTESKKMDSTNHNPEEERVILQARSRTLTKEQIVYLRSVAIDFKTAMNSRILSSYLVTLNPTTLSVDTMFEIAKSPVPDFGPINPHSEAEVKHGQEMAIRYMQIDELAERAKTDANARNKLKLLAETAEDSQVRSYAARKLKD